MKNKCLLVILGLIVSTLFGLQVMAAEPIKIGAPDSLTGAYASDGNAAGDRNGCG